MVFKTRLDAVVKIRQRVEDAAKIALANAHKEVIRIESELAKARAKAEQCILKSATAAEWDIREAARIQALRNIKKIEEILAQVRKREELVRSQYEAAHRQAEAVRRIVENKRLEMIREADRAERKAFDEIAVMQYNRKS